MKTWMLFLLVALTYAAQDNSSHPAPAIANAGWEVSGTVKGQDGPLKGIFMSMIGPERQRKPVKTDSQGRYVFKGSLPGTYTIRIQKPDDASEPRSRTITLSAGDQLKGFDIVLPKGASILGKVLDRAGRPVSGMVVIAYIRSYELGHMRLFEKGGAVTDDRGEYRIAHLPEAAYLIAAVPVIRKRVRATERQPEPAKPLAPAYPPITFAPSGRSHSAAAVVEVRGGEERHGVDITMEKVPVYCIYFRPVSALPNTEGSIQTGVDLYEWLETRGPMVGGGGAAPGQDSQICGVPEGEYRLGALAFTKQPLKGLGYGQTTVLVGKRHADAGALDVLDFQSLNGTVTVQGAKPGDPIPDGIRLVLLFRNRSLLPSDTFAGMVEKNGSFNLAKVYQDTYALQIENLPKGHYVVKASQTGRDTRLEGVRPGAGPVHIELASDGPVLSGRVIAEDRRPVSESIEPGDYKLVAVPDLPESQRRDGKLAARFLSRAADVKLRPQETKVADITLHDAP